MILVYQWTRRKSGDSIMEQESAKGGGQGWMHVDNHFSISYQGMNHDHDHSEAYPSSYYCNHNKLPSLC